MYLMGNGFRTALNHIVGFFCLEKAEANLSRKDYVTINMSSKEDVDVTNIIVNVIRHLLN